MVAGAHPHTKFWVGVVLEAALQGVEDSPAGLRGQVGGFQEEPPRLRHIVVDGSGGGLDLWMKAGPKGVQVARIQKRPNVSVLLGVGYQAVKGTPPQSELGIENRSKNPPYGRLPYLQSYQDQYTPWEISNAAKPTVDSATTLTATVPGQESAAPSPQHYFLPDPNSILP